jgi:hypothetical protein
MLKIQGQNQKIMQERPAGGFNSRNETASTQP